MTVVGLHHVQVACPAGSEDALRGFYGGLLGLPERRSRRSSLRAAASGSGSGRRSLHLGVEPGFVPARKAHPALLVDDVDALAAAVEAAGLPVRWDDQVPGVRRFHTDDPVGNRIEPQQG
ncbi:glyoxalase [Angustibacter aerolatus]|uniref:Glyoxalase n=1 Tax=Angustibacter aerolatus TaxID=1162965 RepID=A0ABQ6JFT2_9ACTN|nr:VOC family protein [Angustibacter aerolatus]GMA86259.1 glyoxalase [Angustibacter aerolatus]